MNDKRVRSFMVDIFNSPKADRLAPDQLAPDRAAVFEHCKKSGWVKAVEEPGGYRLTKSGLEHLSALDEDVASMVEREMFDKRCLTARVVSARPVTESELRALEPEALLQSTMDVAADLAGKLDTVATVMADLVNASRRKGDKAAAARLSAVRGQVEKAIAAVTHIGEGIVG